MNLPNKLSLTRVALIPVMVLLMHFNNAVCRWLAVLVFGAAAFTDFLDGHIARRDNLVTDFGKFVDPVADKLLVLSALIMLCNQHLMFSWVLVVILARELCVDGLRMVVVGKGKVIAAGPLGKIKTVSQIILILWLMVTRFAVADNIISLLLTAWVLLITVYSGVDYFVNNGAFLLQNIGSFKPVKASAPQQPVNAVYQAPMGGYQGQNSGYQQPVSGYQGQNSGYQQPVGGYQGQNSGYQQPVSGYQGQNSGYQQPVSGYQGQNSGYQQPVGGYQQPNNPYRNMNNTYPNANQPYPNQNNPYQNTNPYQNQNNYR